MNSLLLAKTRKNIQQFREELSESGELTNDFSIQKQASLSAIFASCQASLKNAQESINLEMNIDKRQILLLEVGELKSELQFLNTQFLSWKQTCKAYKSSTTPSAITHSQMETEMPNYHKPSTTNGRLVYMGSLLDDHLEAGTQTLAALKQQRSILKGARTRALNMANSLGISQALIRWIDLRSKQDASLFYFGMIFSIFLLIFLYIYFF